MAPNLGPPRIAVAVKRVAVSIGGGLVILLQEEDLGNAVMRQRTVLIDFEGLVEFRERGGEIALLHQGLSPLNVRAQLNVRGVSQHAIVRINRNPARFAESFYRERRIRSHHLNAFFLRLAVRVNFQLHRHPEEIEILRNLSHHAKALVVTQPVNRVLSLELGSSRGIEPLSEKPSELISVSL